MINTVFLGTFTTTFDGICKQIIKSKDKSVSPLTKLHKVCIMYA